MSPGLAQKRRSVNRKTPNPANGDPSCSGSERRMTIIIIIGEQVGYFTEHYNRVYEYEDDESTGTVQQVGIR